MFKCSVVQNSLKGPQRPQKKENDFIGPVSFTFVSVGNWKQVDLCSKKVKISPEKSRLFLITRENNSAVTKASSLLATTGEQQQQQPHVSRSLANQRFACHVLPRFTSPPSFAKRRSTTTTTTHAFHVSRSHLRKISLLEQGGQQLIKQPQEHDWSTYKTTPRARSE